jgi:hypothetical protein
MGCQGEGTTQSVLPYNARPCPAWPYFLKAQPAPRKRLLSPVRRATKQLILGTIDRGWFGLERLRTHVVICGFARAGSTLLQLQIETCISGVRSFGREVSALAAAQYAFRNHPYMLTKDPFDVFLHEEIRAFYATRRADVCFIVTVRDPRSVLTSIHGVHNDRAADYYLSPDEWRAYHEHVRYAQQFEDVLTVEYSDIVCRPAELELRLAKFVGWSVRLPFDQFHVAAAPDFDGRALNGLRPLDATRLSAWRQEIHRPRIVEILRELPDLPERLIEMGYEADTGWVQDYL